MAKPNTKGWVITMTELLRQLRVCKPGADCTNCPMRYEEECEGDPFLVRVRCAAIDAAAEIEALAKDKATLWEEVRNMETLLDGYEWIPLDVELPEPDTNVLIRFKNGDVVVAYYVGDKELPLWRVMSGENWCTDMDGEPTHWTLIPPFVQDGSDG